MYSRCVFARLAWCLITKRQQRPQKQNKQTVGNSHDTSTVGTFVVANFICHTWEKGQNILCKTELQNNLKYLTNFVNLLRSDTTTGK